LGEVTAFFAHGAKKGNIRVTLGNMTVEILATVGSLATQ
jgi:hypothetical protein